MATSKLRTSRIGQILKTIMLAQTKKTRRSKWSSLDRKASCRVVGLPTFDRNYAQGIALSIDTNRSKTELINFEFKSFNCPAF